jgi:hypothetical protein
MLGQKKKAKKRIKAHRKYGQERGSSIKLVIEATEAANTGTRVEMYVDINDGSNVGALKQRVSDQMQYAEVPEMIVPVHKLGFCFRGRMMRDEFPLMSYHPEDDQIIFLRIGGYQGKGHADRFPFCSEPKPEFEAMTLDEIKQELRDRGVYKRAMTHEQLVELCRNDEQKSTRPLRLTQSLIGASVSRDFHARRKITEAAHSKNRRPLDLDLAVYGDEHGKLDVTSGLHGVFDVRKELEILEQWKLCPAPVSKTRRRVFVSITHLDRTLQEEMWKDSMDMRNAIFFFDAERSWVFPRQLTKETAKTASLGTRSAQKFNERYMKFDDDFKSLIIAKEEAGLCFWFRPERSWDKASKFFERIKCPETGKNYNPLQLNGPRWLSMAGTNFWEGDVHNDGRKTDPDCKPRYMRSVTKVARCIAQRTFDYSPVMELIYQSNRNLDPCSEADQLPETKLTWSQKHGLS